MKTQEVPTVFACRGHDLIGMVHRPEAEPEHGVVIVVGGPQYRIGSHRQFLLLARFLAEQGVAVFRFDYTGMGDSEGEQVNFEHIEDDIAAAMDTFQDLVPGVQRIVLWGLCDAVSAILFSAHKDPRVSGLVLVNPWVRTETGLSRARLKHYYLRRLLQPEFWSKLLSGRFEMKESCNSLIRNVTTILPGLGTVRKETESSQYQLEHQAGGSGGESLPERMRRGLEKYRGPVLFILSGDDLTAREFLDTVAASRKWRRLMRRSRVARKDLPEANHTFSRHEWRGQVAWWTLNWIQAHVR
ncbi:MAG: hydrolase 1, exosortase A system-associated [Desulfohalobiaceae bacterium]|nr:hydrolase 1, exosortase A system-associated [Desulfohalobiaceae bacterium]